MLTEKTTYLVAGSRFEGELIYLPAASRSPLLLMAPNWLGVTARAVDLGKQLASRGYVVFVADIHGVDRRPTGAENPMDFLAPLIDDPSVTRARINAAYEAMTKAVRERNVGNPDLRAAVGFCFGGANVLDLARSGADIAAVVSLHGNLKTRSPARVGEVKAAVLVAHGADDPIAPKVDRDAFEAEMSNAKARWTMITFGGVYHSFTDPNADRAPVSQFSAHASRYSFDLTHTFLSDAFLERL